MPRDMEEEFLSVDFEVHSPPTSDPIEMPVMLGERLKRQYATDHQVSERDLSLSSFRPKRTE